MSISVSSGQISVLSHVLTPFSVLNHMKPSIPSLCFSLLLFLVCLTMTACTLPEPMPRLAARGTSVVEAETGQALPLRGVNLGNWLLIEPGVFPDNPHRLPDGWTLKQIFVERFGQDEAERLMELWYESFLTDADFDRIRAFGFNFVRLGFDYDVVEAEPGVLKDDWYRHFDRAVAACEARGIYVLIDMHGAPRRQNNHRPSGRAGVNRFFEEPAAQDRAMHIWKAIAERYKDRSAVFAYEALNEPWGGGRRRLRDFVYRWYDEMREIDPDVILCFPGWSNGLDRVYGDPHELGQTNVMYDMHFYPGFFGWGEPRPEVHDAFFTDTLPRYVELMEAWQSPLLIGEFNVVRDEAGGAEMMKRYFDLADVPGVAMCAWTFKEYKQQGGIGDASWGLWTNAEPMQSPNWREDPLETIEAWIRGLPEVKIEENEKLRDLLTGP